MNRALILAACLACSGAQAQSAHPDMSSDEAGLWMQVDKVEAEIRTSPALVNDKSLNAYVHGLTCRLAADQCGSIRVYIVEVPDFNASMLPNGAMIVQTGLLLRAENEAQLAFVLGHEITHYLHRHALEQFQRMVDTSGLVLFFRLATAGAGVGYLGGAAQAADLSGLYTHSRAQERDADQGGFARGIAAGYDPGQAAAIWRYITAETGANSRRRSAMFLSAHPAPEDRLAAMEKQAADAQPTRQDWIVNAAPFRTAIGAFQDRWVRDQLGAGDPGESVTLFQRLAQNDSTQGLYRYGMGEAYRKRNAAGDKPLASAAYRAALDCAHAAPEAWRGLGLMAMRDGDKAAARAAFTRYRASLPLADDRAMIDFYLAQL